jgi:hypothetical protein
MLHTLAGALLPPKYVHKYTYKIEGPLCMTREENASHGWQACAIRFRITIGLISGDLTQ